MEQDLSTKYTVIPIDKPDHQEKLAKYMEEYKDLKKTSYCRYFLRGLCIMKTQHCKFAHDFDQLHMNQIQYKEMHLQQCQISDKEERKKMFLDKTDFHQRPLFFVKQLDYYWLYNYQFTERYKKANIEPVSQKEINKNQALRHRIRQILHRQQWDKVVAFLEEAFPQGNYTIDMFSTWFAKLGFEKAQTFCKFGDFMRYLTFVKGYTEVNITVPPRTSRSIFYIKNKTYMYQILDQLVEASNQHRQELKKMKEDRLKKMPEDIRKKFICRFYMAGNCQETRESCFYVHNIKDMNYDPEQQFFAQYRQPPKSKEDKMNYISLFRYYQEHKKPQDPELTMDDINSKFGHKHEIRKRVHYQVYRDFLDRLRKEYKIKVMPLKWVKQEHQRFGFNHTDQNKFGQLQSALWELGYYNLDIRNELKEKVSCIAKVPDIEYMDKYFTNILLKILKQQIDDTSTNEKKSQILESSLRRLVYSMTEGNQTQAPLHVYLRKKKKNFKQILQELTPEYVQYIFFESTEENYKKLMELVKKYLKKNKRMIHSIDEIDGFIKSLSIDEINMNRFANYRNLLEFGLLEMGKEIYIWPFVGQALVIDRSLFKSEAKQSKILTPKSIPLKQQELQPYKQYQSEKILVVDNMETFKFCSLILRSCFKYGVDLEGKLTEKGYIDFIQISCINQRKYIFVIDLWKIQKDHKDLYQLIKKETKQLFQDEERIKIFHACQQDVIALIDCMSIRPKPIFDTSGMDIYFEQRAIYQQMYSQNMTYEHTLKKLHHIKSPGLNQILETWKAPNGPNELKEKMKKIFQEGDRSYFETRPIIDDFLQYSARDVEDLIEVHEKMLQQDSYGLWLQVGRLYSQPGV